METYAKFFIWFTEITTKIFGGAGKLALTLFRMSFFGAAHGQKGALPKICYIYPTMMKLGTVIPYLKKILKIYESRDVPLYFC